MLNYNLRPKSPGDIRPIIQSLLEQDLYKFTMGSVYFATPELANSTAVFNFADRTNKIPTDRYFIRMVNDQLDDLCKLRFTTAELDWLFSLYFLREQKGYKEFLKGFQLDRDNITADVIDGKLSIRTKECSIFQASMFEIFVLSIINELYAARWFNNQLTEKKISDTDLSFKLDETIRQLNTAGFKFMEFGIRRRFSSGYQEELVKRLRDEVPTCTGTSNMYLAHKYGLKPMGTMAHEYLCLCQALKDVPISRSQVFAFKTWINHYNGDLGIALSDNLGTEKFLKDFGKLEAKGFDGLRQDSGDPYEWGEKMIQMYKGFGLDPKTKTFCFSDGLSIDEATKLNEAFKDRANVSFGIGTSLTNPFCPTNIVMKMVSANGRPVAKLSNNPGKTMCESPEYVKYLQYAITNL